MRAGSCSQGSVPPPACVVCVVLGGSMKFFCVVFSQVPVKNSYAQEVTGLLCFWPGHYSDSRGHIPRDSTSVWSLDSALTIYAAR